MGITDPAAGIDIQVWPNPTTGQFKVQSAKGIVEFKSLELVDIFGQVLVKYNFEQGTSDFQPDISHLPAGIYFVIINPDNQIIAKKIIKL